MKVLRLDGLQVHWTMKTRSSRPRSLLQTRAVELVRRVFPGSTLYEEVVIPGTLLRLDIVVPGMGLVVEVQGQQHYELVPHFHGRGSKIDRMFDGRRYGKTQFMEARKRDVTKARFCELNELTLVCLPYNEDDDAWEQALRQATG